MTSIGDATQTPQNGADKHGSIQPNDADHIEDWHQRSAQKYIDTPLPRGSAQYLRRALTDAAADNDLVVLQHLLDSGADIDGTDEDLTALHVAATRNRPEAIAFLLQHGAAVDPVDDKGITPVVGTALHGNVICSNLLLDAGASMETASANELTRIVHIAALYGHLELLQVLTERGVDLESETAIGSRALHCAVQGNNVACVRHVLDQKVEVNARNTQGNTPLMVAGSYGKEDAAEIMEMLLAGGADLHAVDHDNRTVLNFAVFQGNRPALDKLISAGANVHTRDNQGGIAKTLVHYLAANWAGDATGCLQSLLDAGADVDARDSNGFTPLAYAVECGHPNAIQQLLIAGADLHTLAPSSYLHHAARFGQGEVEACIDVLVRAGVDINGRDEAQMTPLLYAAQIGHTRAARQLIELRADINLHVNGVTVRQMAENGRHMVIVSLLDLAPWREWQDFFALMGTIWAAILARIWG